MIVTFRFCPRSQSKSLKLPVFKGISADLSHHRFYHISFYPLYLVPKHDVAVLADQIQLLLNAPVLRSNMGKAGREKFEKEFTLEVFEKRMVEILSNNVKC